MPASFSSSSYSPDGLVIGEHPVISRQITLISGENRTRGAVLGKTATAGTINGSAAAGNTGNGTIGSLSVGAAAKEGRYRAVCIEPATNLGTFAVFDPDGIEVGTAVVGSAFSGPINFTIADGSTDFGAGDTFNIDVSAVTYKYKLSAAAATDGSAVPDAILAEDTDASGSDKTTVAYFGGGFDQSKLVLGAGHTAASIKEGLRQKGIHLINVQTTY